MSTTNALVTIAIPVYNGDKYLRQSLDSAINQSYKNLEIIIADNASTDNTQSICEEYVLQDSRIRYHRHTENLGAAYNFKYLLEIANGELFTWLSHDDFLALEYVSKCVNKLDLFPQVIACCSEINFVNEDDSLRTNWTNHYSNIDALDKNVVERVRELAIKVGWYAIYSLFRTDVLRRINLGQRRYADDVLLLLELLLIGEIAKVPEYLFYYRVPDKYKTTEDYIRIFNVESETAAEIRQGSFTYQAKQILELVYASNISMQDKHRIKTDFIDTLTYHNQDWLGRISREQNWIDKNLTTAKVQELLESIIVSDTVANLIELSPPSPVQKVIFFFPHNPYPARTGAHKHGCLEMIAALRDAGCEVLLFSSTLFTDRPWTQESINALKSIYGVETFIHVGTERDFEYLHQQRQLSKPGITNWDYYIPPDFQQSFQQVFKQYQPNLVIINYSLWGKLAISSEFSHVVRVLETHDLFTLTMRMINSLSPHFQEDSIDVAKILPEALDVNFFEKQKLEPEAGEYSICDLYDYSLSVSEKETTLIKQNTKSVSAIHLPVTIQAEKVANTYEGVPLLAISGNLFNLQGTSYFIQEILPIILSSVPDFKLQIIGDGGKKFTPVPGIEISGYVPDLAALYTESGFAVCPLIGGTGQQVKIVEAMAHGLPVVLLKNLSAAAPIEHGVNGFIASDATEFAEYTIKLWLDRSLCQQMGVAARNSIEKHFSQQLIAEKLQPILAKSLNTVWKTPSPQIAIDAVFFQLYSTGIARVWKSLLEEWADDGFAEHLIVLDRAGTAPKISGIRYHQIPAYDYGNTNADRAMLQQVCNDLSADLFISTYYTTPLETSSVFMGYDMIPEVLGFDLNQPMWQEKRRAIEHASAYIAISEHTAQDLVEIYPDIDASKVTVAHCGVQSIFKPASATNLAEFRAKYGITKPYFVIGSPGGYKNTELFLQAFAQLPAKSGFDIIVTGGQVMTEEYRQYTFGSNVHYLRMDDFELSLGYSGAIALVYPSKYEGFGLPIIEAFASGCPVITCPNASIPEVAGEAAIYVFDDDIDGMAEALCEVQKPHIRSALITAGLEQVKQFSWTKMAQNIQSSLIEQTISSLQLQENNFIIFPDWSVDEEILCEELGSIIYQLAKQSNVKNTTLLIDISDIVALEDASLLLSSIAMNLMMSNDLDSTEHLVISLIDELSSIQWSALSSKLTARIMIEHENKQAITVTNNYQLPIHRKSFSLI